PYRSVILDAANDAPTCANASIVTNEDVTGETSPSCSDVDSDSLTYSIVSQPTHGVASVVSGKLHYVPSANYNGSDSFTYKANDGAADSNTASVDVTVNAVNDTPQASNDKASRSEERRGGKEPSCSDVDADSLTYAIVAQPTHGSASVVSGKLHYVPNADYNGSDSFTYKANDGVADSNTASVDVTVNAVNDIPQASNDKAS